MTPVHEKIAKLGEATWEALQAVTGTNDENDVWKSNIVLSDGRVCWLVVIGPGTVTDILDPTTSITVGFTDKDNAEMHASGPDDPVEKTS